MVRGMVHTQKDDMESSSPPVKKEHSLMSTLIGTKNTVFMVFVYCKADTLQPRGALYRVNTYILR